MDYLFGGTTAFAQRTAANVAADTATKSVNELGPDADYTEATKKIVEGILLGAGAAAASDHPRQKARKTLAMISNLEEAGVEALKLVASR